MAASGSAPAVTYDYYNDFLYSIDTRTTDYLIESDLFGLPYWVSVNNDGESVMFYDYTNDGNHRLSYLDFCNGSEVSYTYDDKGRLTGEDYYYYGDSQHSIDYTYNSNDLLARTVDSQSGFTTSYYYDSINRLTGYTEKNGSFTHGVSYTYNEQSYLSQIVEDINGSSRTTAYTYDELGRIVSSTTDGVTVNYTYDAFGRVSTQTTKNGSTVILSESFTYKNPTSSTTSTQIASYTTTAGGNSVTYSYAYDRNGNITSVTSGGKTTSYVYDKLNQLLRENNQAAGKTWVYTYDNSGNILSRAEYAYTTGTLGTVLDTITYTYRAGTDCLSSYDGKAVNCFSSGVYRYDGWTYQMQGTQLVRMYNNGRTRTFTYNADGLRTQRIEPDGTVYNYTYTGDLLTRMTKGSTALYFAYDASGTPMTVQYNGTTYYYAVNLQGDVVAILNSAGTAVVSYTYDAWGRILSTTGSMASTLGTLNPLRYRGYVYDNETGLYYLQSRYYNPAWGRFLTADSLAFLGADGTPLSYNLFAYCLNNPVCYKDVAGTKAVIAHNDGELLSDDDLNQFAEGGVRGGRTTLYRAVSPAEGNSAVSAQKFSPINNSYEGNKFFATSQANAQKWGDAMYKNGDYMVISGTFHSGVISAPGVIFYPSLDGIGSAYLIPNSTLNANVISIAYVR